MHPRIYPFEEHHISLKNVDENAFFIIQKLREKGYVAYLVGGSVRDLLLKKVPKDFDISTSAQPQEIKKIFYRNCILIGKRFRLAHIKLDKKIYEVSTFRTGDISNSELILRDNEWGSEVDDVLRRDFTINGLFYDPENQNILDYVGGFDDAKKNIIRAIGDPIIRFVQDPVRMIRLLKFKARFNFEIEQNTLLALEKGKEEILKSSQARILEELFRMLSSGSAESFFKLLQLHGLLKLLLPLLSESLEDQTEIYSFLKQADIYICKHNHESLERSILASCLLFPILEQVLLKEKNRMIHLGVIAEETRTLINQTFSPFFLLPRNLKATMISIMTNQFRFIPLEASLKKRRLRIPRDPFFKLALKFLKLRCMHQPDLLNIYSMWHEALVNSHKYYHKSYPRYKKPYAK